jgi:Tol biopolymer transport system component
VQLLTGTSRAGGTPPLEGFSWSPDGETLAIGTVTGTDFAHVLDNDELDLFLTAADGSGLRQLTAFPDTPGEVSDDAVAPTFSADGRTVYFARVHNLLHSTIWAIGTDGGGPRQLTSDHVGRGWFFDIPGSVSPAGDELAFTRIKCTRKAGCQSSVRSLSLATGAERLIARRAIDPAYSPDGQRLALASYRGHHPLINSNELLPVTDLYVLDTAAGTLQRMTRTRRVSEGHPSWDPSGQRIAFSRGPSSFPMFLGETDAEISGRLLQINPDGSCPTLMFRRAIRQGPFFGRDFWQPAWQPGPGRGAGPISC